MQRHDCLIAFGSNLGQSDRILAEVVRRLDGHQEVSSIVVSRCHTTPAVGGPIGQNQYTNACLRFGWGQPPEELMSFLLKIELDLGRERAVRWASRNVDLDLLLFGEHVIDRGSDGLILPHPRMSFRRFVLEPAVEIAAEMVHPESGLTISDLINHLDRTPDHIGWASSSELDVCTLTRIFRRLCAAKGFRFSHFVQMVVAHASTRRMKFMAYIENDQPALIQATRKFPGPLLVLPSLQSGEFEAELGAALDATRKF